MKNIAIIAAAVSVTMAAIAVSNSAKTPYPKSFGKETEIIELESKIRNLEAIVRFDSISLRMCDNEQESVSCSEEEKELDAKIEHLQSLYTEYDALVE